MTGRTHYVYRALGADGDILYVGMTRCPERRSPEVVKLYNALANHIDSFPSQFVKRGSVP